jgi:uncharacterized membrane protein
VTNLHIALKLIHILGAAVLFGTGLGIAFFMVMAHRTRDTAFIAQTARVVVIADAVFTASAVIVQPLSGAALIWLLGYSWREPWIVASLGLYLLAGLCWLPVVWIQTRLRDLAIESARRNEPTTAEYRRLFRIWFALGWPAFLAVIAILVLMIAKPV